MLYYNFYGYEEFKARFGLEKRVKERKNTYGGSPNANLDQRAQV